MLMHGLTGRGLADCVGRGTGLDDGGLGAKETAPGAAFERRAAPQAPLDLLAEFGGYEIAMLAGAALAGAARQALVLVDGFTLPSRWRSLRNWIPACWITAYSDIVPKSMRIARCCGISGPTLLDLGMRLGEGSGAALALSVVRAAVALFTEMATFEGARGE